MVASYVQADQCWSHAVLCTDIKMTYRLLFPGQVLPFCHGFAVLSTQSLFIHCTSGQAVLFFQSPAASTSHNEYIGLDFLLVERALRTMYLILLNKQTTGHVMMV